MTTMHYIDPSGEQITWEVTDAPPAPLDASGVAATLNAVLGVWSLRDAANAVGLAPDALVAEAQAWAAASDPDA